MGHEVFIFKKSRSYKILYSKNKCTDFSTYSEDAYQIKMLEDAYVKKYQVKDAAWLKTQFPGKMKWIEYTENESRLFECKRENSAALAQQSYEMLNKIVKYLESRKVVASIQFMLEDSIKVYDRKEENILSQKQLQYYCIIQMTIGIEGEIYRRVFTCGQSDGKLTELFKLEGQIEEYVEKNWVKKESLPMGELEPGIYKVIMSPEIAALFMHEAIGHLLEADNFFKSDLNLQIGAKVGESFLNVVDDPTISGLSGSLIYDDEGEAAQKKYLIRKGRIETLLGDKLYAGKYPHITTGNARAKDSISDTLIRMSNTYIVPEEKDIQEEIKKTENAVYLEELLGGNTNQNLFYISVGRITRIQNGQKVAVYKGRTIVIPILDAVNKICFVGNQLVWTNGGLCGKMNQNLPVSMGSPHIIINQVEIK